MKYIFWLSLFVLVIFRYLATRPKYHVGDKIRIIGRLSSEPLRYSGSQVVNISNLRIYLPSYPAYPEINYGDRVLIEGYVDKNNKVIRARLISFQKERGFYALRRQILGFYQKSLPEPHGALVAGVTIGSKESLPSWFWDGLRKTGTAHVVVASGMNVSLVALFLLNILLTFLNRKKAIIFVLLGIWFYAFLSGFEAPIIRASIMTSLAYTSYSLGKLYSAWRALALSALFMLVIDPDWVNDIGFMLSFVSTASLMLFEKKVNKFLDFIPRFFRESFSTSLAAQIGVAPILFVAFGQFNPLSPIINAFILWTIPLITIVGGIAGFLGIFIPFLSRLILLIVFPLTWWVITIIKLFS